MLQHNPWCAWPLWTAPPSPHWASPQTQRRHLDGARKHQGEQAGLGGMMMRSQLCTHMLWHSQLWGNLKWVGLFSSLSTPPQICQFWIFTLFKMNLGLAVDISEDQHAVAFSAHQWYFLTFNSQLYSNFSRLSLLKANTVCATWSWQHYLLRHQCLENKGSCW